MRTLSVALVVLSLAAPAPMLAQTPPPPWTATQPLGRPPRPVTWRADTSNGAVHLHAPGLDATLPIASFTTMDLRAVTLAGGAVVDVLTASGEDGSCSVVIAAPAGRPRVVWSERTDLRGDVGERHAGVVDVSDRTGDGVDDVIVGEVVEGVHVSGADRTILDPRAIDPRTMALVPVALVQLPTNGETGTAGSSGAGAETPVTATTTSPGPTAAPAGGPLRFVCASSTSGATPDEQHRAPRMLETPGASFWAEGRGGPGRGEFVTARRELSLPIRAFAITPLPGDAAVAARLGRPTSVWIVGENRLRLHVTLPDAPPGTRLWVVPPEPEDWQFVTVMIDAAAAPAGARDAEVHTALASVEAYTDLDFAGGVARLVRELQSDGPAADAAADALARAGAAAVGDVVAAIPRMTPIGRRRTVRALAHTTNVPAALAALETLARDADTDVRAAADAALVAGAGISALARVAITAGPAGDDAAAVLAAHGGDRTMLAAMLAALDVEASRDRPALRAVIAATAAQGGDETKEVVRAWAQHASPDAVAAAALALAPVPETRSVARELVAAAALHAEGFVPRWRLAVAAAALPKDDAIGAWLRDVAHGAEEWMLRDAALQALLASDPEGTLDVARAAAADPYPRVRLTALRALARGGAEVDVNTVAAIAVHDHWPLVRAAAVTALGGIPRARPVVKAAVGDANENVRAAAITALAAAGDRSAYELVDARLRDEQEWPVVVHASLSYVDTLCVAEAGDALVAVVHRAVKPNPYEPDVETAAAALQTAVRLGGPAASDALGIASRSGAPEQLRAVAAELRAHPPAACGH